MNPEDRSVVLWVAVLLVTVAGLLLGVELGIRAGSAVIGGLLGILLGFFVGVFGARLTLGR